MFEKRKQRTYGLVRNTGALAAPYPYVLYSDLYDHREFIRGVVNMGFSGLLWTPELRDATSTEDLVRRLQRGPLADGADRLPGTSRTRHESSKSIAAPTTRDRLAPDWESAEATAGL